MFYYNVRVILEERVDGHSLWSRNFTHEPTVSQVLVAADNAYEQATNSTSSQLACRAYELVKFSGIDLPNATKLVAAREVILAGRKIGTVVVEAIPVIDNPPPADDSAEHQ